MGTTRSSELLTTVVRLCHVHIYICEALSPAFFAPTQQFSVILVLFMFYRATYHLAPPRTSACPSSSYRMSCTHIFTSLPLSALSQVHSNHLRHANRKGNNTRIFNSTKKLSCSIKRIFATNSEQLSSSSSLFLQHCISNEASARRIRRPVFCHFVKLCSGYTQGCVKRKWPAYPRHSKIYIALFSSPLLLATQNVHCNQ